MIQIETGRLTVIYVRTNRRVKWQFATYGGRYRNKEEVLRAAEENMGDVPYEYQIWDMVTDEVTTGFVNWPGKH